MLVFLQCDVVHRMSVQQLEQCDVPGDKQEKKKKGISVHNTDLKQKTNCLSDNPKGQLPGSLLFQHLFSEK